MSSKEVMRAALLYYREQIISQIDQALQELDGPPTPKEILNEIQTSVNVNKYREQIISSQPQTSANIYKCKICGQICQSQGGLNAHSGIHNKSKKSQNKISSTDNLRCELCDKAFDTSGGLKKHKYWMHNRKSSPHKQNKLYKQQNGTAGLGMIGRSEEELQQIGGAI